jgi:phenylacrylic acid decarboxylase
MATSFSIGFFEADGMLVFSCSMKVLSIISNGYCDSLIARAANLILKERCRHVFVLRKTPFRGLYLLNMLQITQSGAIIFLPVPSLHQVIPDK